MNSDAPASRGKMLALLRPGPFRRYIIGSVISDTGTWMQVMAQGWLMSTLTNKAILLGMVNFAGGIPTTALTMIGGSRADKYDKRKILICSQFAQTALALILGILVYTGRIQVWYVVVVAAFLGICIAFEMPAINALVPELVKQDEIATAIALDRSVFHGSRLVGPSLAGLFVAWWGAASAFFCNAISFVALIIALISLPPRAKGTAEEEEQRRSGFKEGLLFVRSVTRAWFGDILLGLFWADAVRRSPDHRSVGVDRDADRAGECGRYVRGWIRPGVVRRRAIVLRTGKDGSARGGDSADCWANG